jgi:hypothetical protein
MTTSTAITTRLESVTLTAQFVELSDLRAHIPELRFRPTVEAVTGVLWLTSELITIAIYLATEAPPNEPVSPHRTDVLDEYVKAYAGDTVVTGLSYASPLEITWGVSQAVLGSVSAFSALIYGIKRIYGLDLELKAHREEQRAKFEKAKEEATRIEPMSRAEEDKDEDFLWPPGVRSRIDYHRTQLMPLHRATRVTLKIDDDDR